MSGLDERAEAYLALADDVKFALSIDRAVVAIIREQRAEIERLRNALVNVIAHTGHTKLAPDQLHIDLLANIERIARAAIDPAMEKGR